MERVIGYKEVEIDKIISRPVRYSGQEGNGFHSLKPITRKIKVMQPIFEDLGRYREDQNMFSQFEMGDSILFKPK